MLDAIKERIKNYLKGSLNRYHIDAAKKELKGQILARRNDGKAFDHVK
jgi:hypothetical protein